MDHTRQLIIIIAMHPETYQQLFFQPVTWLLCTVYSTSMQGCSQLQRLPGLSALIIMANSSLQFLTDKLSLKYQVFGCDDQCYKSLGVDTLLPQCIQMAIQFSKGHWLSWHNVMVVNM